MAIRKSIPSYRCTSPKVIRGTPVWVSTPIMASPRPRAAAKADFAWFVAAMPPSVAKASVNRAKYSAGPNSSATFTSCGASRTSPQVAKNAPTKEATPDSASASPARPACAIG